MRIVYGNGKGYGDVGRVMGFIGIGGGLYWDMGMGWLWRHGEGYRVWLWGHGEWRWGVLWGMGRRTWGRVMGTLGRLWGCEVMGTLGEVMGMRGYRDMRL